VSEEDTPYNETGKQQKTLRDEFAMVALDRCMYRLAADHKQATEDAIADTAYRVADAMMREREKEKDDVRKR